MKIGATRFSLNKYSNIHFAVSSCVFLPSVRELHTISFLIIYLRKSGKIKLSSDPREIGYVFLSVGAI
ncbi:hypothetical protein RIR_jg15237.t1 [Rhizophagus irregularis DAOM 181602=DAOM 197198]|nr:hypothetical protein RIR_jg15237.t1 [Rhizophagus irregularis DAOM 181602=DAOM 197198]